MERPQIAQKFWLQYEESNWEFLKRVASQIGTILLANPIGEKPEVYVGFPKLEEISVSSNQKSQWEKELLKSEIIKENTKEMQREPLGGFLPLEEDYAIGVDVRVGERVRTITGKVIIVKQAKINYYYQLQNRKSQWSLPVWKEGIVGLALKGKILEAENGKARVHLAIDKKPPKEGIWFPIATPYGTEKEMGLYCMPEEGEPIELILPEKEEAQGFLRSGI